VIAEDGHTYEKEAITKWVKEKGTSPKTRERIGNMFFTNWDKKSQIAEFFDENKLCSQAAFIAAVKKGNVEEVKQLNYLDDYLEAKDDKGLTPLHIAAQSEQSEMVIFLLNQGANIEAKTNRGGYTPLHLAVSNETIVDTLLKAGAKINAQTDYDWNALHIAAAKGYLATCKLLVQKEINLEAINVHNDTALLNAAMNGQLAVAEFLINAGARIEKTSTVANCNALYVAIDGGHIMCAKLLIEQGVNLECPYITGTDPLQDAASRGYTELVEILLNKGAQLQTNGWVGKTPLHMAAANNHEATVSLLLAAGALTEARDAANSDTPLHFAAAGGQLASAKLLIKYQANLEAKNNNGYTPLHLAAAKGQ
ncbi:MAG: ankyrin repeat domain-containing protein, partial [Burkholderiales bacterium]